MPKKTKKNQGPWLAITVGILGLIAGYSIVVVGEGSIAFAGTYQCPMHKQVCQNGDCSKMPECAGGACAKDCPGNCGHAA